MTQEQDTTQSSAVWTQLVIAVVTEGMAQANGWTIPLDLWIIFIIIALQATVLLLRDVYLWFKRGRASSKEITR